jgi:DNA primase
VRDGLGSQSTIQELLARRADVVDIVGRPTQRRRRWGCALFMAKVAVFRVSSRKRFYHCAGKAKQQFISTMDHAGMSFVEVRLAQPVQPAGAR